MSLETPAPQNSQGLCRNDVMWQFVLDTDGGGQWQLEKLGRRQSTTVYDGQSVMMMMLSEDDLEPRGTKTGGTR